MKTSLSIFLILSLIFSRFGIASVCESPDNETLVQGDSHCLVIETTLATQRTETLVVVLHGDTSRGGPVDYAFRWAKNFAGPTETAVGMARPGYTAYGRKSSGTASRDQTRDRRYSLKEINSIGTAIARLKSHHQPKQLILVGHSGGALITGVLLGSQPDLIDGALLVSCPCNVPRWRTAHNRTQMGSAQSPHKWLKKSRSDVRIIALTGSKDGNTFPWLAKKYVEAARKRGIQAEYLETTGSGHSLKRPLRTSTFQAYRRFIEK